MDCTLDLAVPTEARQLAALQRRLRRHAGVASSHVTTQRLQIDNRQSLLRAHGISLQLERSGGAWRQLLQTAGGEIRHADFNGEYTLAATELPRALRKKRRGGKLKPRFELTLRTSTWPATAAGVTINLGRGQVRHDGKRLPVACLCLSGPASAVHALAEELAAGLPVLPFMPDPATLGYAFAAGGGTLPDGAVHASVPDLTDAPDSVTAFCRIAEACVRHWQANREGAIRTPDQPEYVHQLRVAIRRLRAALQVFRPQLPDDFVETLRTPLRDSMAILGRTRDLDVLITEIVAPVCAALPDNTQLQALSAELARRRADARTETSARLQRPQLAQQLIALHHHLAALPGAPMAASETTSAAAVTPTLPEFVDRRLRKRLKDVRQQAALARIDDPASLHALRIAIKRLRYGLEFFDSLLPKGEGQALLKRLARLQNDLGQLNDLANAGMLLSAAAGDSAPLREAVALIGGWHGARHAALLADIGGHLRRIEHLRLPRLVPKPARQPGEDSSGSDAD